LEPGLSRRTPPLLDTFTVFGLGNTSCPSSFSVGSLPPFHRVLGYFPFFSSVRIFFVRCLLACILFAGVQPSVLWWCYSAVFSPYSFIYSFYSFSEVCSSARRLLDAGWKGCGLFSNGDISTFSSFFFLSNLGGESSFTPRHSRVRLSGVPGLHSSVDGLAFFFLAGGWSAPTLPSFSLGLSSLLGMSVFVSSGFFWQESHSINFLVFRSSLLSFPSPPPPLPSRPTFFFPCCKPFVFFLT